MAGKVISTVTGLAEEIAGRHGLELVDVEYVKESEDWFLRIFIYKKEGVGIDDCVSVHRELDSAIEETIEIPGPYTMEVSSPGYERAFKKPAEYERYMGEMLRM